MGSLTSVLRLAFHHNFEIHIDSFLIIYYLLISILVSEPFIESLPQVHLLLVLLIMSSSTGGPGDVKPVEFSFDFWLTFSLSVAAASFGITKFVKAGPASIMRNDKWLDGFGTWTFILVFLNIFITLCAKGFATATLIAGIANVIHLNSLSNRTSYPMSSLNYLLTLVGFLPQILHVSSIVLLSGLELTLSRSCRHLVLLVALWASRSL